MLKGYEREQGETIDQFTDRVNAGIEEFRAAAMEVQGPNAQIASDGRIVCLLQLGKMEGIRTAQGVMPGFRPFTREEVTKRLTDRKEGKGAFRMPGV